MEDWEVKTRKKKDTENEARFLAKYGNIVMYDKDEKRWIKMQQDKMKFETKGPKNNRGYILYANELGKEDDDKSEWLEMHLELACDILENSDLEGFKIIKKGEEED